MTRLYVGTCSWADHTNFYPERLPANQRLGFYAQHFPVVELDATFYHLMPEHNFQLWAERTPPGFLFDVKPYRQLSWHDRENPPDAETFARFSRSVQPLRDAGKLRAMHIQFPPWFVFKPQNLDYIKECRDRLAPDRLSVEFRHQSWLKGEHVPQLIETLRDAQVGLTVVDEPQVGSGSVPTVLAVTMPELVIVRFHGRNAQKWYAKVERTGDRFDYLYSEAELQAWVPKVAELAQGAQEMHLLFNNNNQDYAVRNARQLRLALGGTPGAEVVSL
jgi:uncharacterized protein YecE (DUF72 family)